MSTIEPTHVLANKLDPESIYELVCSITMCIKWFDFNADFSYRVMQLNVRFLLHIDLVLARNSKPPSWSVQ